MALLYRVKKELSTCKYFSQEHLPFNPLIINVLQNLLFCVPKAAVLHGKIILKIQLIENKEVTLFVQLNW